MKHGCCRCLSWIVRMLVLLMLGGCAHDNSAIVKSIEVVGFGLLEFDDSTSSPDPTSSIGAKLAHARKIRISRQTDRIPLRVGVSYGIAFVVQGTSPDGIVEIQVALRSSSPCVLKETGELIYHNDTVLSVKLGDVRHVGATIAAPEDSFCRNVPGPGIAKFELRYRDRKFAEKTFEIVPGSAN